MIKNTGVLPPKVEKTDWSAGDTGIVYKEVCYDWTPFLPVFEQQRKLSETYACVSFSCLNTIETQLKQQGININFSDRFLAKSSGTTSNGNSMQRVLDSFRNDGWLLESDWPYLDGMSFNEFYAEIPQTLKDKALKNKADANWEVKYEWVNMGNCQPDIANLKVQLRQSPLQRITTYNSGACGNEHATEIYKIDGTGNYIFDTYNGGLVKNSLSYPMPFIMKIVVQPKLVLPTTILPITKDLVFGQRDIEVKFAQQKLIKLGYLAQGLATGYYFNLTQLAVKKFQFDYKVASAFELAIVNGKRIGLKTRVKLNAL